jgi:hypothetical protein
MRAALVAMKASTFVLLCGPRYSTTMFRIAGAVSKAPAWQAHHDVCPHARHKTISSCAVGVQGAASSSDRDPGVIGREGVPRRASRDATNNRELELQGRDR